MYLIDWDTAGIVLVVPFRVHKLSGDGILASTPRTRRCWRRRQIVAIKVDLSEGLGHSRELGVLRRCRRRTRVRHCRRRTVAGVQARLLADLISVHSRTYEQCV
jgi:hypothetical protein